MTDPLSSKTMSQQIREEFAQALNLAHDSTHYEGCWKNHWPCVLEMVLDELDRQRAEIEMLTKAIRIVELKASGTLANNLCPDHRDKQTGKPCLACEVERLTRERDEARKPPHCINCHCEESAKGMIDLSDYLDLHRGLMAVVYESKSHAEAVLFSERALRHAESEHVISEAASSATAPNSFADQNRALVAEIATRRGITLGHLREDGGCELAQIMRRLDAAEAEVERLRGAPHCPTCGCGASEPNTPGPQS
jgi:hypothetical protein